jgi:hypothetical protein
MDFQISDQRRSCCKAALSMFWAYRQENQALSFDAITLPVIHGMGHGIAISINVVNMQQLFQFSS